MRYRRPPTNGARKGILAHRQQQPACHPLSRASAKRPAEMLHQPVQPLGPPGEASGNRRLQPFREYPTGAFPLRAPETPHLYADHDVTTVRRQVGQSPSIPTANHPRYHAARGTGRAGHARAGEKPDRLGRPLNPIHHQTGRSHFPPASIRSHRSSPLHDLGHKTNQARKRKMCIEIGSEPRLEAHRGSRAVPIHTRTPKKRCRNRSARPA